MTTATTAAPAAEETRAISTVTREAFIRPDSFDREARTVEVCWTTGARGKRFDWTRWQTVDEELATDAGNVRLDRLNSGASVLAVHKGYELSGQIGVVVDGSARMENGEGIATVRFSKRAEVEPIMDDVEDGIIRNLSVGYQVHTYEITETEGERPLYRAVDWEPYEISFVPIPFDAGAQTRSGDPAQGGNPCIIRRASSAVQENDMTTANPQSAAPAPADPTRAADPAPAPAPAAAPAPAPTGVTRFTAAAALAFVDQARAFGDALATRASELVTQNEAGTISVETARSQMLQEAAEAQRAAVGQRTTISVSNDNADASRAAIAAMLAARTLGQEVPENAREFMGMRLLEIAAQRAGVSPRERDAITILRAANTSSDFPLLLEAAGNKVLLARYQLAAPSFKRIAKQRHLNDFKVTKLLRIGDFPTLLPYKEDGEIKSGTINEGRETVQLGSFGRILTLSRQAIVNDDLNAFDDVFGSIGTMVAQFENANFYAMKAANSGNGPKLADNKNLFHTDHGNLAGSGAVPSITTLGEGRAAMRKQKNIDGNVMNLTPKLMLVGADIETVAEQLTAPLVPNQVANVNAIGRTLEIVPEAALDGFAWELYADPQTAPAFVYGSLADAPGPRVISEEGFKVDGMSWRVTYDFYSGAIDYRPAYRNAGADPTP